MAIGTNSTREWMGKSLHRVTGIIFLCECVELGPTINPTVEISQYIILHPIYWELTRKARAR
jgi:hypothetical protein